MSRPATGSRLGRALVIGPPFLWLGLFCLVPLVIVAKISLSESATAIPPYRPLLEPSLDVARWRGFVEALGVESYRKLASDALYGQAALSSLAFAAVATMLIALVGYPLALAMARAPAGWRPLLVALVVVPFWTSFLVRVYAWIAILKPDGWLNAALIGLGLIREPLPILDTNAAVLVGLVYAYLPFLVLPVYATLERLDPALPDAAADLGASPLATFWTVTFPLSLPGLAAGALLCFIPIVGEFVVLELLGGPDALTLGRTLWSEFFSNRDWPLASAVAILLLVIVVGPVVLFREGQARRQERARLDEATR